MSSTDHYRLEDRYLTDSGTVFLTGIQALARLPIEQIRADQRAGLNTAAFVSGYQGSPLGGYGDAVKSALKLAKDLPIVFKQGTNEEYAATAVMGSQLSTTFESAKYDGVLGVWYGKAPGVDRAADALRHAVFAGTSMHGGAIALVGDDPNAKSSTVPSSSAGLLFDMHMPLLYPGDPSEALDFGRHAIALSRTTGLWSALKIVADVADATANVDLHPERFNPVIPLIDGERYQHAPDGRLLTPHTIELEREIVEVRYELARSYAAGNKLNHVTVDPTDAWIGIVSSGITYREVREALSRLGLDDDNAIADAGIRLLKMGMPMPFNPATIRAFSKGLQEILVIEEKQPNLESLIKDALYDASVRPKVVGKHDDQGAILFPAWGALDADSIIPPLRARLEAQVADKLIPERRERIRIPVSLAVERVPFFCSGCPHNRSTEVPDGSAVGAGIGCHTMTLLMDPERVGDITGITSMGNEGTQWIGIADFVDTPHLFQNLGDGTYFHSGQLAIQAAIEADVNITYKLLYNGTVAMTGGQDPAGQLPVPKVALNLLTQGAKRVLITADEPDRYKGVSLPAGVDVWHRERLMEAQETLAGIEGVTVLIHDQACAAEARRDRKRGIVETPKQRVLINERICEGCGDCGQVSNCLSVQPVDTFFGRKTKIDQTACNLDYSCLEGDCPSFMEITVGDEVPQSNTNMVQPPENLPSPGLLVPDDEFAMRITGIGGTGVVTVAQVLGTAAMLDGFHVRGLDQIGLSQKAGPVVSDIRLSKARAAYTNRLGEAQADLLLAFDQLVGASSKGLLTCSKTQTVVVGSTSTTPTGHQITNPDQASPTVDSLIDTIGEHTRTDHFWADAQAVTKALFGNTTTANLFVVGMAVQAGALPISPERIEEAVALNGVAVEANTLAFRWGRAQVADPELLAEATAASNEAPPSVDESAFARRLDGLGATGDRRQNLARLAHELVAWGKQLDADTWFDVLDTVKASPQGCANLVDSVAHNLYKLTAYKDEYEVARLMLDAATSAKAADLAGNGGKITWKLHPPMLRALGMDRKIAIGTWATPGIRLLAKRKNLRGGRFDPFGRAEVRVVERELAVEYVDALTALLPTASLELLLEVAELPQMVRGYEDIKLANVTLYRARLAELMSRAWTT